MSEQNNNYSALGALAALGQLWDVNGLWYNNKKLILDGYRFNGCRFDNCTLHINSANFELINCHIDQNTFITYGPEILKVIKLYNSRYYNSFQALGPFAPEQNMDNTITIKGL